jgi:hypothetical protein
MVKKGQTFTDADRRSFYASAALAWMLADLSRAQLLALAVGQALTGLWAYR